MSFKNENKRNDTELSKHLWLLKDQKKDFFISWKILAKAKSYTNLTKRCNLCNTEKFYILHKPDMATLNKRNKLLSTCRHKRMFLLKFNRLPIQFNSIQFYFSHVQRDSIQYIKKNKHLYYKGGLKTIRINLFGLV